MGNTNLFNKPYKDHSRIFSFVSLHFFVILYISLSTSCPRLSISSIVSDNTVRLVSMFSRITPVNEGLFCLLISSKLKRRSDVDSSVDAELDCRQKYGVWVSNERERSLRGVFIVSVIISVLRLITDEDESLLVNDFEFDELLLRANDIRFSSAVIFRGCGRMTADVSGGGVGLLFCNIFVGFCVRQLLLLIFF